MPKVTFDISQQWRIWFAKPNSPVLGGMQNQLRLMHYLDKHKEHTIKLLTNRSFMSEEEQKELDAYLEKLTNASYM